MATPADIQGSGLGQSNQDSLVLGGSEPTLQGQNGAAAVQASPTTLAVVGAKQTDANHFPVTDVAVLGIMIIVVVIGVGLWFKE